MPAHKMTPVEKASFVSRATAGERLVDLAKEFNISFRHAQRIWKDELAVAQANAKEEVEKGYPFWLARGVELPPLGNAPAARAWAAKVLAAYHKQFLSSLPGVAEYVAELEKEINALSDKEILHSDTLVWLRIDAAKIVKARKALSDEAIEALQKKEFYECMGNPLNDLRSYRIVEGVQTLTEMGMIKVENDIVSKP